MLRQAFALLAVSCALVTTPAAANDESPLGIALEGYAYPYPVAYVPVEIDGAAYAMAYMDVMPRGAPNGATVVLMHGKNFVGYYFANVIDALAGAGYRSLQTRRRCSIVSASTASRYRDIPRAGCWRCVSR